MNHTLTERWHPGFALGVALASTLLLGMIGRSYSSIRTEVLDIPGVSSPVWESHPAEDPVTHDLWFVRSDNKFEGWRIWVARCEDGHFGEAQPSPIGAPGLEADPVFIDGGRRLLYISTRSTGASRSADLDIWESTRTATGWSAPVRFPTPVNSDLAEWFPRLAPDGWLYFGSSRSGGQGKTDIWRARRMQDLTWLVENLGPGLNTSAQEFELSVSQDGTSGLLATDNGMFRVQKIHGQWRRGARLGTSVNGNGTEIGPVILSSGTGFLFSRDLGGQKSGELIVGRIARKALAPFGCLNTNNPRISK